MAAPSGIVWGSIYGGKGRLGIYTNISSTNTQTTVNIQVWFWTKYSCTDSGNTLYYNVGTNITSATTSKGSFSIDHSKSSGSGWSTSNQTRLINETHTYTRSTSAQTYKIYAQFNNIDYVGATVYANTSFTVPALPSYSVIYNANGGSGAPTTQTKYYDKTLTLSSTKPTRTGYAFQGWGTSSSSTTVAYAAGASYTANAAITLYAVWKAITYTVTYNANGGSLGDVPSTQTKTYGVALTLTSAVPTKTDYMFKGWGTSVSSTSVAYSAGASYTANAAITLYAIWELSYVKPRINDLIVERATSDGTKSVNGTYIYVYFDWVTDKSVSSITIQWKPSASTDWESSTVSTSGTNGTVNTVFGSGGISTDSSYSVKVTVADSGGSLTLTRSIGGTKYVIDFLSGGNGAAFGKPAELDNVLDINFQTRHLGGLLTPVIPAETDLDTVRTPNTYIGANTSTYNYINCPLTSGTFSLLVESGGESGQVRQRLTGCSKEYPRVWERWYYESTWGDWVEITAHEFVLFDNTSGTDGTVTLSETSANFKYIEVYFTDNNLKGCSYQKIYSPDGKMLHLSVIEPGTSSMTYIRRTGYTISGTTITPNVTNAGYWRFNGTTHTNMIGTNYIKIVRVIGIR